MSDSQFPKTVSALRAEGSASVATAQAIAEEWPVDANGRRSSETFTPMAKALEAEGFTVSYHTARTHMRMVDLLGENLAATVATYGFTQTRDAVKSAGRGTKAQQTARVANVLKAATNTATAAGRTRPTVSDVGHAVKGSADKRKGGRKVALKPKAPAYTVAQLKTASSADLAKYLKALNLQVDRASKALAAR